MSDWYTATGAPVTASGLTSATMRNEFTAIETAMAKLPTITANGSKIIAVNSGATALEAITSVPVAQGGTGATDASTARTNLGLGTVATLNSVNNDNWSGTDLALTNGGTGASSAADARTNLGLGALAVLGSVNNDNWSGTDLAITNGGTGASDASTARSNLGLGSLATASSINNSNWSGADLGVANGGTGVSSITSGAVMIGAGTSAVTEINMSTKGHLLVGTASGPQALSLGTDGHVLTADSNETAGVKWAAAGGGGGVGTMSTVKANGSQVGGADIVTIDFASEFTVSESPNTEINVSIKAASESQSGIIEVATDAQVNAGSVGDLAIRPSSLAQWAGSSNITTVGTISSGVWQGTAVGLSSGGTGATSASGARTNLGLGSSDTPTFSNVNLSGALAVSDGGTGGTSASAARTNLGLGSLATLSTISNSNWSGTDLAVVNGGTGSSTASGARSNLGLGSLATLSTINNSNWSGTDLAVTNGGTGSSTASGARSNLGLGSIATRDLTVSTSSPSGGSDGDLWFVREI